ncbi:hypothetical protein [Lichenicoccus sp.]|uniref:hypothetical protein n=1 Tax=Lichenicoccus sp. TaxID=2781899 RepID=UPI003D1520C5
MKPDSPDPGGPDPRAVARFLRENPDWLAGQSDLYRAMAPPRRVHGEILADHMAAMLDQARRQAASAGAQAAGMLRALRAGAGLAGQVQEAILALSRTDDLAACILADLPALLGIDAALLCSEGGTPASLQARALPPGAVAELLGTRDVVLRAAPDDPFALHGEAALLARHDALLRVAPGGMPPMLLALAARDDAILNDAQRDGAGHAALGFLGRVLAARIEALWPDPVS